MSKWIDFIFIESTGKTEIYKVVSKESAFLLGHIKWHGPWRQYVFFPQAETIFEKTCLEDIKIFLIDLMSIRKEAKKNG